MPRSAIALFSQNIARRCKLIRVNPYIEVVRLSQAEIAIGCDRKERAFEGKRANTVMREQIYDAL
jgi:hypothetical protein